MELMMNPSVYLNAITELDLDTASTAVSKMLHAVLVKIGALVVARIALYSAAALTVVLRSAMQMVRH